MKLIFNIEYHTVFGEELLLNHVVTSKDGQEKVTQYRMSTVDGQHWTYQMTKARNAQNTVISYFYSVDCEGATQRQEWSTEIHRLELNAVKGTSYTIYDRWLEMPEDTYLYSSAFTECINRRRTAVQQPTAFSKTVRVMVRAPQLREHERLALVGRTDALGSWNTAKALPMYEHARNEWTIDLHADSLVGNRMEFKFVAEGVADEPLWETGYNRTIELADMKEGDVAVYMLEQSFFEICNRRLAGTLVPVFSLRSKDSFGVGDFGDLKKMTDWVSISGQRVLQVLPINDTTITHTWTDSYPYSCISVFALHPQYADLTQLPQLKDEKLRKEFEEKRRQLNSLPQIDYVQVNEAKTAYLKALFGQEGAQVLASDGFRKFFAETEQWLVPYARYCQLRDSHGTGDFSQWPDHCLWDEHERKHLSDAADPAFGGVAFYYYVQYILNTQMAAVHDYARAKGVVLKGDIPIGVSRYGCDVWMESRYFNLAGQAGAPPDDFSVNGQNWGFPTYNWEEMLKDGCAWWERRFRNMQKFFDAYRIDHVLGFFRIWEIPVDSVHGLLGQFAPAIGLSREEIEAYGLCFREERFLKPYITDEVIARRFGDKAEEVRRQYLWEIRKGEYEMRPEYDTQRKVETAFAERTGESDETMREGLYTLISDVLFVRDRKNANLFHPRISAQLDYTYKAMDEAEQTAFNRIYDDYFYRRNNQFWYREAMKKLPRLVQATRMMTCAEDLGMVPDCVPWVMNELKILSLEIQSMPKESFVRFGHLSRNPYRSVCTISSHDMPTLRQWWDEDLDRTQLYYNTMLYRGGSAPHPLPGWLAREIIACHLACPSMLCVVSIQDWLGIDEKLRLADADAERINIPANPHHYWRYRMHVNIEDLMENVDFMENLKELIRQSGRY
uniref:4-alpha-glucanotransferase n=1 Tax=Prevotella sp. GTC17259 TaxID=3236795 RepID=A0AB33J3Y0_9BACT